MTTWMKVPPWRREWYWQMMFLYQPKIKTMPYKENLSMQGVPYQTRLVIDIQKDRQQRITDTWTRKDRYTLGPVQEIDYRYTLLQQCGRVSCIYAHPKLIWRHLSLTIQDWLPNQTGNQIGNTSFNYTCSHTVQVKDTSRVSIQSNPALLSGEIKIHFNARPMQGTSQRYYFR